MRNFKTNGPGTFQYALAQVPESTHVQPVTMGQFVRFMTLLNKDNKALRQRVTELEKKVNGEGDGSGDVDG